MSSKIIKVAENEVGYLEKASNKDLDSKTANAGYNNWTKYGRDLVKWIGSPYANGVAWCDMFVDWCMITAYGLEKAKKLLEGWSAYTPTSAQYFVNTKKWYRCNPKVGDQIFFVSSGKTREIKNICHTGLVYKVDDKYVYTIEGNTSSQSGVVANGGCVAKKQYHLSYERICGYGRPDYSIVEKDVKETKATTTTTNTTKKTLPTVASPTLRYGNMGTNVKYLQQDLNYIGKYGLVVDGEFGTKTKQALSDFQFKHNLYVDGIYGIKTRSKMAELIK